VVQASDSDPLVNTATASGQPTDDQGNPLPGVDPVEDTDTASVDLIGPAIAVAKEANVSSAQVGDTVTYTYNVTNPGDTPLGSVSVSDDKCAPVNGPAAGGDANGNGLLDPDETWVYSCDYVVQASDSDPLVNTATASGQPTDDQGNPLPGVDPVEDTDTASVDIVHPAIHLEKSVDKSVIVSGETVIYTYEVTNPGDDPLSQVDVSDDTCSPVVYQSGDDGDGVLQPGEVWTYTCSMALTQDTTNTATATATASTGQRVEDTDTARVDVISPQIAVTKTADPAVILSGDSVKYTYQVSNPGDTPLSVSMSDDTCSPVTGPDPAGDVNNNGLLDPGEVWTYTCTTTVTGDTTNTITATGQPTDDQGNPLPGIDPVNNTATATVDVVHPGTQIVKSASTGIVYSGEQVIYSYEVTNTGDTPVANPDVTDDQCAPVTYTGGDTNNNGLLDVDETWTYECATTLTQDTTNTATASGQPTDDQGNPLPGIDPVEDADMAFVDVINPAIRIEKTPSATQVHPGDTVTYSYEVTNPGDDPLTNVAVSDDACSPMTYQSGDDGDGILQPGEAWTYTCSMALNDDTTNTATVTGDDSLGNPVTDEDKAFVDVLIAGLQIDKSVDKPVIHDGETVTYSYEVTATGSDPVHNVAVSDDTCSPVTFTGGDTNNDGILDLNETWTYTCSMALSQDTTNIVTATGEDALGQPVPQDQSSADVVVIHPAIHLVKSVDKTVILSGETVAYTYEVTNPGDDPLDNVAVSDDACSPVTYQSGDANNDGLLQPGEVWTFTCSMALNNDTTNTATATGEDSLGAPVDDADTANVDVVSPEIAVTKSADKTVILPGGTVLYTYDVTNPGDTPLANPNVSDDKCAPVSYQSGDTNNNDLLDVGETWTYQCTTQLNADTTNTATASGQPSDDQGSPLPGIDPVNNTATATVDVVHPGMQIGKTASATTVYSGDTVTYSYEVTNTGDTPVANPDVTDDQCAPVTYTGGDTNNNGLLDVDETWTYECATTLTQDTTNTATASGQPTDDQGNPLPGIDPVEDADMAFVDVINPAIAVVKTANVSSARIGDMVTYTYDVTNTGDDVLTNVTVSDDYCSPVTLATNDGNGLLDPGETWTFTCDYTVQSGDPDPLVNTATATGDDSLGNPVEDTDTASVDLVASSYTLTKTLNTTGAIRVGDVISFTIAITNTGGTWLAELPLTDEYDTTYLSYGGDGHFADPPSDDNNDDGQIDWSDLTDQVGDLAPGDSVNVIVWFTTLADTSGESGGVTMNTATAHDVMADPDGPNGPLPPDESLDDLQGPTSDTEPLEILQPTGLFVADFSAQVEGTDVTLAWETVSELNIADFRVLRRRATSDAYEPVGEFVMAQWSGMDRGGAYTLTDRDLAVGRYVYLLQVVTLDGRTVNEESIQVTVRSRVIFMR